MKKKTKKMIKNVALGTLALHFAMGLLQITNYSVLLLCLISASIVFLLSHKRTKKILAVGSLCLIMTLGFLSSYEMSEVFIALFKLAVNVGVSVMLFMWFYRNKMKFSK